LLIYKIFKAFGKHVAASKKQPALLKIEVRPFQRRIGSRICLRLGLPGTPMALSNLLA
jgi:hypothetical protein